MKLQEILDKALPFESKRSEGGAHWTATFTAGDRVILFQAENEGLQDDYDEGVWSIAFGEKQSSTFGGETVDTYNYDKTNSGKEFDVFSTLKAILQKFIKECDPEVIEFSAEKDKKNNRSRLYAKLFQKNLPKGWVFQREDGDDDMNHIPVYFMMVKESLDKSLPYKITRDSAYFFDADFKAGNRLIRFEAQERGSISKSWEVSFYEIVPSKNGGEIEISKKTGNGNEFEIFATIKTIIEEFIKKREPKRISIDSFKGEANRGRLYQRMLSKNAPAGWKLERDDKHPSYTTFHLVKTD